MHLLGAEGTLLLQDLGLLVLELLVDLGTLGWLVAMGSRLGDVSFHSMVSDVLNLLGE